MNRGHYKPSQEADRYQSAHHSILIFRPDGKMNIGKFKGQHHSKLPPWYLSWCWENMAGWAEQLAAIGKPKKKKPKEKKLPHNKRLEAISERARAAGSGAQQETPKETLDTNTAFDSETAPW